MKRRGQQIIYVYADWLKDSEPVIIGTLFSELLRGKEVFSFKYDNAWFRNSQSQLIDPDLQLYSGIQYLNEEGKNNFGVFLDSSPDRWGRILMRRRESLMARIENRSENNLFETDYLLGVYDANRMGGLRFKLDKEGPFLNDDENLASPPWTSIRDLEQISLRLEDDDVIDDPNYAKWLNMLVAPGSSLGGARPKASVMDANGDLWIAKFPSKHDFNVDIGAWEKVTYDLAVSSGVIMAESMAKKFSSNHHTFLTKRFDRLTKGKRIHFASAMTMLGYTDGQDFTDGASYLELVEFITTQGANVNADLEQLWRRIVFSICVSNTDDHLRNHGFILSDRGWLLSPAYDINPIETGIGLKLNISENDNSLDLELAFEVSEYFRLNKERAQEIIEEVKTTVSNWRVVADKYGISRKEQELKSRAFRNCL